MVSIYKINNKSNNNETEINEHILLKCISLAKQRNKKLYDRLVTVWERLHGERFNEKHLEEL